jgi:hypothetical protein
VDEAVEDGRGGAEGDDGEVRFQQSTSAGQ